ncbi:MAG TPA: hypothetical protein VMU24_02300 [Candidatus Acidoferrales bacterium]|nr:hypothetical protein [Candidatus Acidoferrales bacterium]
MSNTFWQVIMIGILAYAAMVLASKNAARKGDPSMVPNAPFLPLSAPQVSMAGSGFGDDSGYAGAGFGGGGGDAQ